MPIYEYRCNACGFQKEFLQKMSDPQLTVCPECGKETFDKMVTAAGFQLKGSGWYVTDFRDGPKDTKPATTAVPPSAASASTDTSSTPAAGGASTTTPAASATPTPSKSESAKPSATPSTGTSKG